MLARKNVSICKWSLCLPAAVVRMLLNPMTKSDEHIGPHTPWFSPSADGGESSQ
jgi:hypothetical protein